MKLNFRLSATTEYRKDCSSCDDERKIFSTFFPHEGKTRKWKLGVLEFNLDYAYSDQVLNVLSGEVEKAIKKVGALPRKAEMKILFVGVGNPCFTADSFGVDVSNNISNMLQTYFASRTSKFRLFYFNPDIRAKTGLNTIEIINQVISNVKPDVIFLFDCFATKHMGKIGCCLQVKNTALKPASAMGDYDNHIKAGDAKIISIGAVLLGVKPKSDLIILKSNADLLTNRLSFAVSKAVVNMIYDL